MTKRVPSDRSAELAQASGFYKSNLFKLQLDDLLADLRPNYDKQVARLQNTLHKLKETIENIPERPAKAPLEAEKELRNTHSIIVPYPQPRPVRDTKYSVSYLKPTNVNVVGSFSLRTGAKSAGPFTVDLAVTMPKLLFQEKDYTNHRFFHKRAYYIACLAAGIKETEGHNLEIKFGLQDGDSLRPVIILTPTEAPKDSRSAKPQIRIITAIEDTLFPISRTLPMKNNIRQGTTETTEPKESTPFYNAALRSEATVAQFHKSLYSAARNCESFRDACILGRTWLQQRGFGSSIQTGGFGGFEWTALMSLLFEGGGPNGKPVLLKSYSSYQLFKATIQFLAGKDLTKPLLLSCQDLQSPGDGPVVFDGVKGLNVLYKMTPWSYGFLRREAETTLKMLNESRDDNFERVFIFKVNESLFRFDRIATLPLVDGSNVLQGLHNQRTIYEVLKRALNDRAELIYLFGNCVDPWSVETKAHRKAGGGSLHVGLLLNADNAARVVDHGPSAEEKEEAASFRSFWGDKAELRRFKDGSIRESLVWTDQPQSSSIVHQILIYILHRHLNCRENEVTYIGDEYDEKLRSYGDGVLLYSSPPFQTVTDAFSSLEKSIHSMDEVPLTVRHLAPASSFLRYTALHARAVSGARQELVNVVLQFESSMRWPDDLGAIQMTKIAFLVRIGDCLTSSGTASSCRVGLENESSPILNNAFLEIVHESGVTFHLRIHHDREQTLLERQLKAKSPRSQAKQEIAYALSEYKRQFIHTPRLTQAIRTLCTRFPLLSPTIRLLKHWFDCHLFTGHVSEELVELLAVRTFTQPFPWETPSSVMVGFLRTLHLISRWDWQQEPLMVDLGGALSNEVIEMIRTRFSAWRNVDPALNSVALFVASDVDPEGVTWTQHEMPPKVVAARMSTLAKAAVKLVREKSSALDISDIFHTSLAPYDFILTLRPGISESGSTLPTKYKNLQKDTTRGRSKAGAVRSLVRDLQSCYSPQLHFFYGGERGDVIAGLWNPQILKAKSWNLKMAYSTSPVVSDDTEKTGDEVEVVVNRAAILNEISRLGALLVDSVEAGQHSG
ncbi:pre-rRNA processing protein Utp22 [Aspergillus steynii IBT 23096]|uniref:U3 small nucleolar RNA-associated protein 22 n=1 Tax=Aspergillus steynii IBT 23096 TaxID=1392250 RepID=A0A2I2GFV2_9EURO|nr:pre-rRNA processing protein Utp22 [Aspergillus steynii IBT 23096]PLB51749.1 pre-rRNA processing protein Utp22 [Aspergillus steynii IBT 23096]